LGSLVVFTLVLGLGVGPARAAGADRGPDVVGWLRGLADAGEVSAAFVRVAQSHVERAPGAAGTATRPAVDPPVRTDPVRVWELAGKRTPTARFFELSDGRMQAEITSTPEVYLDGEGDWRPIDARLRASDEPGFQFSNEANQFASRFGDRSDRLARFEFAGRSVTVGAAGQPRAVSPVAEGDTVTFRGVFPQGSW
jgi:hypothetical protein